MWQSMWQSLNEKPHTWLHRQKKIFATYIVYRCYKPCEFLGFVQTNCWGHKSNYVITSLVNCDDITTVNGGIHVVRILPWWLILTEQCIPVGTQFFFFFLGGYVPQGFSQVGSAERIFFLRKLRSWEQSFAKISVWCWNFAKIREKWG